MATDGVHPRAVEFYNQLVGYVFTGQYLGVKKNKDYGTLRAVFEVDGGNEVNQDNVQVVGTCAELRTWISKSSAKMWRGFSGEEDCNNNDEWDVWIWAPKSCALNPSCEEQQMDLEITSVEFFEFNYSSKHDYEVGVNIRVEIFDSFGKLKSDYEDLRGVEFFGSYIGRKPDAAGDYRPVFEVDPDVPFNEEVVDKFDDIRESWKSDGRRVLKSFTDGKDSHKGYDWNLWIWGSEHLSYEVEDEEMTFTITGVDLNDYGPGKYEWTAEIYVQ